MEQEKIQHSVSSFESWIARGREFIVSGRHDLASAWLKFNQAESEVQNRIVGHYLGINEIYKRDFKMALYYLKNTIEKFGNNVRLQIDIVSCLYRLERIAEWNLEVEKLHSLITENEHKLSFQTRNIGYLNLAKFSEEQGRLNEALKIYKNLYESQKSLSQLESSYIIMAQIIRLGSQINIPLQELGKQYQKLLLQESINVSFQNDIEIQHSLCLAELRLIGIKSALRRVNRFVSSKNIDTKDKIYLLTDILEELLNRNQDVSDLLKISMPFKINPQSYEGQVFSLAKTKVFGSNQWSTVQDYTCQLTPSSYMRLCRLISIKSKNKSLCEEIRQQMKILVSNFEDIDRTYWLSEFSRYLTSDVKSFQLQFEPNLERISYGSEWTLNLSKRKNFVAILALFRDRKSLDVDDAIKRIWNTSFSISEFERLRINVHRLNQEILKTGHPQKIIQITSQSIQLTPVTEIFFVS